MAEFVYSGPRQNKTTESTQDLIYEKQDLKKRKKRLENKIEDTKHFINVELDVIDDIRAQVLILNNKIEQNTNNIIKYKKYNSISDHTKDTDDVLDTVESLLLPESDSYWYQFKRYERIQDKLQKDRDLENLNRQLQANINIRLIYVMKKLVK